MAAPEIWASLTSPVTHTFTTASLSPKGRLHRTIKPFCFPNDPSQVLARFITTRSSRVQSMGCSRREPISICVDEGQIWIRKSSLRHAQPRRPWLLLLGSVQTRLITRSETSASGIRNTHISLGVTRTSFSPRQMKTFFDTVEHHIRLYSTHRFECVSTIQPGL